MKHLLTTDEFLRAADLQLQKAVESLVSSEPEQLKSAQSQLEELVRSFCALGDCAYQEMREGGAQRLLQFRRHLAGAAVLTRQASHSIDLLVGRAGLAHAEGRSSIQVEG